MSNELIERLAREAGMDDVFSDGSRFQSDEAPSVGCAALARFAALVAERCARIVDREFDDVLAQAAIRAAFPMPKD